jgi:hypothetical protein
MRQVVVEIEGGMITSVYVDGVQIDRFVTIDRDTDCNAESEVQIGGEPAVVDTHFVDPLPARLRNRLAQVL